MNNNEIKKYIQMKYKINEFLKNELKSNKKMNCFLKNELFFYKMNYNE